MSENNQIEYKPEYCEQLVKFMAQGYSLAAFGAEVRQGRSTLYEWVEKYPEFKKAHIEGQAAAQKMFEALLVSSARGVIPEALKKQGAKYLNTHSILFALKTRFHKDYSEKKQIQLEHSGSLKLEDIIANAEKNPDL